ncbi:DUF4268 domain-containing protein [Candidatus Leptofilum sp.]|uniref:DUF4268 domain-containing protein n=1 Tax=Candidatus Leptofilum sp. TaxID=3241576 RepID=UPI003B59B369
MSYEATDLIVNKPAPQYILPQESLLTAITNLLDHDERFLPVVKDEACKVPIGLLTGDSVANALRNFGDGVELMRVIDVAEKIALYREDAEVAEFFEDIQRSGAVAVVDQEDCLINLITVNDTSDYFHALAYDMILLEDIEKSLRDHIEAAYTDPDTGDVNYSQLSSAIHQVLGREKPYNHLTLSESTRLFCHPRTWSNYGKKHFSVSPKALANLLDIVRQIRNPWAHFRANPTPAQRKQLKFAQLWFKRNDPVYPEGTFDTAKEVLPIESTETLEKIPENDIKIIDEVDEKDSKYAKLAIFLNIQPEDTQQLKLSFDDIEEILGFALPKSAREHRAWWSNDSVGHSWSKEWLDVDWRVASVNMTNEVVRFARIKERQKAYIDFYSVLINELGQKPGFDHLQNMPDGVNWYWTKGISVKGKGLASFTFSFGRGSIFRVELYIDSGDQTLNKQIYDGLAAQKAEIEAEVSCELTWQRLDHRRASRIAQIFDGHITDSEDELENLRQKAIPAMMNYVQVLQPRVEAVAKELV